MKKDVADLWVAALRSGKYKQGKTSLCRDGKYCCLGVLYEVAIQNDVKVKKKKDLDGGIVFNGDAAGISDDAIVEWAGWDKWNTYGRFYYKDGREGTLAHLNDVNMLSFKEIADVIEKYWEQL